MATADSIGMMNKAYAVPRGEVLQWLNDLLSLTLSKIEQLGTGAVYCQIFDIVYPGAIQMNRVSWNAKNEYEYLNNFKLLQKGFDKQGQKKHIEVQKLCKCKYQDNLEFAQWLKAMYDMHGGYRDNYNPEEKRGNINVELLGNKMGGKGDFNGVEKNTSKSNNNIKGPSMNNKMKLNHVTSKINTTGIQSTKIIEQSKKENLLISETNRPIKKITGVNGKPKLSESDGQLKSIMELVSNDEDPYKIVSVIRSMFGVKIESSKW